MNFHCCYRLAWLLALTACGRGGSEESSAIPVGAGPSSAHVRTSTLHAGPQAPEPAIENPYVDDAAAIADGERLYSWMNCAGCHGALGGGAIGPPLADTDWIYGGEQAQIHQSIVQGRPNGMPSFGHRLPDDSVWRIAAFVRTLSEEARREETSRQGPTDQGAQRGNRNPGAQDESRR